MKTLEERCYYCGKYSYVMHHYKIRENCYIPVCDYCLAKIANSIFNNAFSIRHFNGTNTVQVDYFDGILLLKKAIRLARKVKNKSNLDKNLAEWAKLSRQNTYYHFKKLLVNVLQL